MNSEIKAYAQYRYLKDINSTKGTQDENYKTKRATHC